MKFNGDSHYVIGGSHVRQNMPCQDHALSGMTEASVYITLSDGCSTGGETDTGSRILNYATVTVLKEYLTADNSLDLSPKTIGEKIRAKSSDILQSMGMTLHDLQATLLYAVATPAGGFIHVFGDGCVVLIYNDGRIVTYRFLWKQNTPFYLSYTGETVRYFLSRHQVDEPESFMVYKTTQELDGAISTEEIGYPAADMITGYEIPLSTEELSSLKSIILCSDGIESFKAHTAVVDPSVILKEISSIKQWQGEFVKRRLSRMLQNFSAKGMLCTDDISVAAIHIDAQIKEDGTDANRDT